MSRDYSGVAVLAPTTVPYQRYSEHGAARFIGRCLADLLAAARVDKTALDGLAVSSMTLAPDTAVSLSQHFGLSLRWRLTRHFSLQAGAETGEILTWFVGGRVVP